MSALNCAALAALAVVACRGGDADVTDAGGQLELDAPIPDAPIPDGAPRDCGARVCTGVECELPRWAPVPPAFTVGDEMVFDATTGLEWERFPPSSALAFADAKEHCEALRLSERCDWRLPLRSELASIHDFTRIEPANDPAAFDPLPADQFGAYVWSSSPVVGTPDWPERVWTVGQKFGYAAKAAVDSGTSHVRCVRETEPKIVPPARFEPDATTVHDIVSGLTWEREPDSALMFGSQAAAACEARTTGGLNDWRVPTLPELLSIADVARFNPALDPAFLLPTGGFWTSTTRFAPNSDFAFVMGASTGGWLWQTVVVNSAQLRCVR